MVALMERQEVQYESAQDLLRNNAADGSWKGKFKDKFEERAEQIDKIAALINEGTALDNIMAAQQAQVAKYIIDPITGEIIETEGSDGELSVAAAIGLLERGASEAEIEAALNDALASIAGKIAANKKHAKKYMAELLELLHVLEVSIKQTGKNLELQTVLRQMQERVSKLMKGGNVLNIQEFLRSQQLQQVLQQTMLQARQMPQMLETMRIAQEMIRNLANQAKNANLSREAALQNTQANMRDMLQMQMRTLHNILQASFKNLSAKTSLETTPATRDLNRQALLTMRELATKTRDLAPTSERSINATQAAAIREQLAQILAATRTIGNNQPNSVVNLNEQFANNLQMIDARITAQKSSEGNFRIAEQASRQNVVENLQAVEKLVERAVEPKIETIAKRVEEPITGKVAQPVIKETELKEPALKVTNLKDQRSNDSTPEIAQNPAPEPVRAEMKEPADPCKGCSGGKGCCSSIGKVEAQAVETKAEPAQVQAQQQATQQAVNAGKEAAQAKAEQQYTNSQRADVATQAAATASQEAVSANEFADFMSAASQASPSTATTATSAEPASQSAAASVDSSPSM